MGDSPTNIKWVDPIENWYVWHINESSVRIGRLTEEYRHVEMGAVMSYISIVDRLRYGHYTNKFPGY